ncbi:hypothetical protein FACS1894147_11290 [Spirochaetia bacterium]|nr:hypothetical protein FACS1894147_11290 [Spirochaetia bacterium]
MNKKQKMTLLLLVISTTVGYTQSRTTPKPQAVFDYQELFRNAQPIQTWDFYRKAPGKLLLREPLLNTSRTPHFLENYMYYFSDGEAYLRTKTHSDILVPESVEVYYEFDNYLVVHRKYKNEIWTMGKNSVLRMDPIDTSVLINGDYFGSNFMSDWYEIYGGIDITGRIRGNILLFFDRDYRARIYRFKGTQLELLTSENNPLQLHVPELNSYKEPFIIDGKIYMQNIERGTHMLLGETDDIIQGDFVWYKGNDGRYFTLDIRKNITIPCLDTGYPAITLDSVTDQDMVGFCNVLALGDLLFYLYNEKGETIPILQITNSGGCIKVVYADSKLYISMYGLGIVYDIKTKRVLEAYRTEGDYGDYMVVFTIPFGGQTYIYKHEDPIRQFYNDR